MNLESFISFRKNLQEVPKTSIGLEGLYVINNQFDIVLLQQFEKSDIRELYHQVTKDTAILEELEIGDKLIIKIDLFKFPTYYEDKSEFIQSNKLKLQQDEFYIFEIDYRHNESDKHNFIENYLDIQRLITLLTEVCAYPKKSADKLELLFHQPENFYSLLIDFDANDLEQLTNIKSAVKVRSQILESVDSETYRSLFVNEMMKILSNEGISFRNLLKHWNLIYFGYKNSLQLYLADFSFEKIKTASHEHFHELTDKIYSSINKFSSYILAIPVAYILIVRFFDFEGTSLAKDTFLIIIGLLYFVIIWFVLLNNLNSAFTAIQNDITSFLDRIKNQKYLEEVATTLEAQKTKVIPSQKRKIKLVRVISLIILTLTLLAYCYIYHQIIIISLLKSGVLKLNVPPCISL